MRQEERDRESLIDMVEAATKIRGMRNLLIHQYEGIDMRRVWEVVERDIPVLKAQVVKILSTD